MIGKTHTTHWRLSQVSLIRLVTIAILLGTWQAIAVSGLLYEGIVPQPYLVAKALVFELIDPSLYVDLGYTMFESLMGFLIGSTIAIVTGIWLGGSSFSRRAFEPYILALASMPKVIFLPILFLVFGLGIESKIAKAAMSAFFPTFISTVAAFLQIDKVLINVGRSFDLKAVQMARMIYIPAIMRPLMIGLQLSMAMSIIGVLSAEIAYANVGLGARMIHYSDQFNISSMYAVMIIIFAVTSTINHAFSKAQAPFLRYERSREQAGIGTRSPRAAGGTDKPAISA